MARARRKARLPILRAIEDWIASQAREQPAQQQLKSDGADAAGNTSEQQGTLAI